MRKFKQLTRREKRRLERENESFFFIDPLNGDDKNDGRSAETAKRTFDSVREAIDADPSVFRDRDIVANYIGSTRPKVSLALADGVLEVPRTFASARRLVGNIEPLALAPITDQGAIASAIVAGVTASEEASFASFDTLDEVPPCANHAGGLALALSGDPVAKWMREHHEADNMRRAIYDRAREKP